MHACYKSIDLSCVSEAQVTISAHFDFRGICFTHFQSVGAGAEFTKLWRELAAMEPESGGILHLPERAKLIHPQLRDKMIVRPPYVQLHELVQAHANSEPLLAQDRIQSLQISTGTD